jgi:hypothetical protein
LVFGSKNDVCINPIGLIPMPFPDAVSSWISSVLGGGLGGKLDFLIGTKTELVWGPSLSMELSTEKSAREKPGEEEKEALKFKRNAKACPVVYALSVAMGVLSTAWVVVHSLMGDDEMRVILGGITQTASFALLTAITIAAKTYETRLEKPADKVHEKVNSAKEIPKWSYGVTQDQLTDAIKKLRHV